MTCGDVDAWPHCSRGRLMGTRARGADPEHSPNLTEPSTCLLRSTVAGRFVQVDVPVTACIRFRAEIHGARRNAGPARSGRAAPGLAGAETYGGVMVRRPKSGNGTWPSVYYFGAGGLTSPRSQARALHSEMDPLTAHVQADGSTVAHPSPVTFDSVAALHIPPGDGTRQITVTVISQLPEQPGSAAENLGLVSELKMTYGMSVVDLHRDKWYVNEIGVSTEAVGGR